MICGVDLVADVALALEGDHVLEARALGDGDRRGEVVAVAVLVGDVLDEQHEQDVVLVLAGIHAATELVAGGPERGVEVGFLDRHFSPYPSSWEIALPLREPSTLELLQCHHHGDEASMLGHRHRLGAGEVDSRPKPYFASFALRVCMELPAVVEQVFGQKWPNAQWIPASGRTVGPASAISSVRPSLTTRPRMVRTSAATAWGRTSGPPLRGLRPL